MKCFRGCGKDAAYQNSKGEWTCSKHHLSCTSVQNKRKQSNIEKYGYANPLHKYNELGQPKTAESVANRKATMDAKYGHLDRKPWADTMLETLRTTNMERFGVEYAFQAESVIDAIKITKIEKYDNPVGPLHKTQYQKSAIERKWLDELNIPGDWRNKVIPQTTFIADAIDIESKIVYEFYGDYWHGNPEVHNSDTINKSTKCTFGELYQRTLLREEAIKNLGYTLVTIWERDYRGR